VLGSAGHGSGPAAYLARPKPADPCTGARRATGLPPGDSRSHRDRYADRLDSLPAGDGRAVSSQRSA